MSNAFVLDTYEKPLNPVHPGRARLLLKQGKAAVFRRYPFTIILTIEVEQPQLQPLRLKLDPGSKTTGIALVNDASGEVVFAAELAHRGAKIKSDLESRRGVRRGRRARHTRYRKARFNNRRRPKGWLPPSLMSRVHNIETWVYRLRRYCPIAAISMELVRFDMQAQENPDIQGQEYQQGTLAGYELREYLLEKWGRACSYCGKKESALQVEHIQARANGGSNRVSNLCLACEPCNLRKGTQDITGFLAKNPALLKKIQAQAKAPLKDAAAVNATRWTLFERLEATGLPVECGSGGRTKFNRVSRGLEKTHWCDAANVGASTPPVLIVGQIKPLLITSTGHGSRQMGYPDKFGFLPRHRQRKKVHHGFQTGEIVRANPPKGKYAGRHVGRVLTRATGSFDISKPSGRVTVQAKYCSVLHHNDGYCYTYERRGGNSSPA